MKTGSADFMAFKFNATGVVGGDITVDQNAPKPLAAEFSAQPNGSMGDGTGEFEFGINCPTCGGGASDQFGNDIVFHVAGATIADLTQPNNLGNIFVADVINTTDGNGNTGPIDVSGPPRNVPDSGSTALLLGLGLFGLGFVRMPLRKKSLTAHPESVYERATRWVALLLYRLEHVDLRKQIKDESREEKLRKQATRTNLEARNPG